MEQLTTLSLSLVILIVAVMQVGKNVVNKSFFSTIFMINPNLLIHIAFLSPVLIKASYLLDLSVISDYLRDTFLPQFVLSLLLFCNTLFISFEETWSTLLNTMIFSQIIAVPAGGGEVSKRVDLAKWWS